MPTPDTVSFGYDQVPAGRKTAMVGEVFSRVARKYDIMNDAMSGGMHRLWKDRFVRRVKPREGEAILDMAGGTGDIAFRMEPSGASITVADINPDMLAVGMDRAAQRGIDSLVWSEQNAERLSFPDRFFDAYIYSKDSNINEVSRQFSIRVKIDDPDRMVKPGMFARVLLTLGPSGERLVVPTSALSNRDDEARTATVYKVVDGKVQVVDLELGPGDDDKTIVLSGLEPGDKVVVQTANPLSDGQEIDAVMVDAKAVGEEKIPTSALTTTPTPGGTP